MYEFIKEHPVFVYNNEFPQSGCFLQNTRLYWVYIAKAMVKVYNDVPINSHDFVEFY